MPEVGGETEFADMYSAYRSAARGDEGEGLKAGARSTISTFRGHAATA